MASIELRDISFRYPIRKIGRRRRRRKPVPALKNISLTVGAGDRVGLIGNNGAGKSTLLRVLAGIYVPQRGVLEIRGRVTSLLSLSVGLDYGASGRENIVMVGMLLGFSRSKIEKELESIADFAEVAERIDQPVGSYSQGMTIRLVFAIAVYFRPEILLLDEWISNGDAWFVKKIGDLFNAIMGDGNLFLIASHRTELIETCCNKVLWMEEGAVKYFGDMGGGLSAYRSSR